MKNILAIVPVRNRVNQTLAFLSAFHELEVPSNVNLHVLIIDDGSSDGTAKNINANFPNVKIHSGDGSLYWSGAVQLGIGLASQKNYDHVWLLNDDSVLNESCLVRLLEVEAEFPGGIYTGSILSSDGRIIYGGLIRRSFFRFRGLKLNDFHDGVAKVDTVNGNCLLIACSLVKRMSLPNSNIYIHEGFDLFLGLEASRLGSRPLAVQHALGFGVENHEKFPFYFADTSLRERFRGVTGPKGIPPKMYWDLCYRFAGWLAVIIFLKPYIRILIPFRRDT